MESLIKQKKYFEFLKKHQEIIDDLDIQGISENKKNRINTLEKLSKKIKNKLENFDQKNQKIGQFDMSKLEQMKEQGNKNFFEKMYNLKQKNPKKKQKNNNGLNLLELNQSEKKQSTDLFDMNLDLEPKQQPQTNDLKD